MRVTERETAFGLTRAYHPRVEEATDTQVKPIIRCIREILTWVGDCLRQFLV